jgi:hypothetical protein
MTLRTELDLMYKANPTLTLPKYYNSHLDDPLEMLTLQHDSQHIVFGCGTGIEDELALQIYLMLLSDLSPIEVIKIYGVEPNVDDFVNGGIKTFLALQFKDKIGMFIRLPTLIVKCLFKRMTSSTRFGFNSIHEYLDWEVVDIRKHFEITPYHF